MHPSQPLAAGKDPAPQTDPDATPAAIGEQARAWAIKLKTGQPTAGDVAVFRQWRAQSPAHASAWAQASQDWKALAGMAQAFEDRHPQRVAKPPRRAINRRIFLGAAASAFGSLAVVGIARPPLGLWPSWSELGADYRTATGEQRDLQLANRIQVAMNTQTSLSVRQVDDTARIALIAGEAAVSARHAPCEVLAEDARIEMSNGALDVRRLASGQVRLRCTEGSARLFHPARTLQLAAGQQVVYDRGQVGPFGNITSDDSGWRQGVVVFDNLKLADAIDEINRYRSGRVVLMNDALANRRFSANFKIGALDDAIELLRVVHNVKVRRVGELVFLS